MHSKTWGVAVALLLGASLALAPPTFAGAGKGGVKAGHAGKRLAKLSDALALTDAQKAQIKPILMDARTQRKAIKGDASLTPEDSKAKLKALRKDTMSKIGAVLTPEQKQKLAQMRHDRKKAAA